MRQTMLAKEKLRKPTVRPSPSNWSNLSPQTLAGKAILFELGAQLGLLDPLLTEQKISVRHVAHHVDVKESFASAYYAALAQAGLAKLSAETANGEPCYSASSDLADSLNEVSYIVWGLVSCAPLISNARAFSQDARSAAELYHRDGEHVARTSKWMGEHDWYPHAEAAIVSTHPRKIIDLGSGSGGLLIRCLRKVTEAQGIGIDENADACARAKLNAKDADLDDRLSIVEAPIQNLLDDSTLIEGADVIHAGFVFHDLMPEDEETLNALLRICREKSPTGKMVIVEAVPYSKNAEERAFSAAFTFLHHHFMGRRFLTEEGWKEKLSAAGYRSVVVERLGASGGRIFTATPF